MTDVLAEFDALFAARLENRAPTFRKCFELLLARGTERPTIVETGCLREPGNWAGDGQSTALFEWFAELTDGSVWSVDINPAAVTMARSLTGPRVQIVLGDSADFLARFPGAIDLLYLDSMGVDDGGPGHGREHCLAEFRAAEHALRPGSIVLVDDSGIHEGRPAGKGAMLFDEMHRRGVPPMVGPYQVAWLL